MSINLVGRVKNLIRATSWQRVLNVIIIPNIIFAVVAISTRASVLIGFENLALAALSVAICVAFLPAVTEVFHKDHPLTTTGILCLGVFTAWSAFTLKAAVALLWRYVPALQWIVDSDINSYASFVSLVAATMHIAAPASIEGGIPTRRWVKIGAIAAVGVFVGMLLIYVSDLETRRRNEHKSSFIYPHSEERYFDSHDLSPL